jgi:hypothetical protein
MAGARFRVEPFMTDADLYKGIYETYCKPHIATAAGQAMAGAGVPREASLEEKSVLISNEVPEKSAVPANPSAPADQEPVEVQSPPSALVIEGIHEKQVHANESILAYDKVEDEPEQVLPQPSAPEVEITDDPGVFTGSNEAVAVPDPSAVETVALALETGVARNSAESEVVTRASTPILNTILAAEQNPVVESSGDYIAGVFFPRVTDRPINVLSEVTGSQSEDEVRERIAVPG